MAVCQKVIPLRQWVEREAKLQIPVVDKGQVDPIKHKNVMIIRKITVAYGISEILRHLNLRQVDPGGEAAKDTLGMNCSIDNFAVRVSGEETPVNIEGVDMLSPVISSQISEPSFLSGCSLGDIYQDQMGRFLEVEILDTLPSAVPAVAHQNLDESATLYSFGQLLYELFSHIDASQLQAFANHDKSDTGVDGGCHEPALKKRAWPEIIGSEEGEGSKSTPQYMSLQDLGFPSSLSLLVQNLVECRVQAKDAYDNLQTSSSDLHLLLLEPDRFLFDQVCTPDNNGKIPLQFRQERLYGRETEVSQIQEAFCRVSSGQSEALFIDGFSGSGKTRLVQSLKTQVDVSGGYVVVRKFDSISKERSLLGVVSAFNDLCILIKEKNSSQDLDATAASLLEAFGSDIFVLARLLPNLSLISHRLKKTATYNCSDVDQMNVQSVSFVLQRFMRVVSSKSHPVMLFLDDLQWCDNSALTVIEGILSDKEEKSGGGSCLFFVGSYRSNEVCHGHLVYYFMENLDRHGVLSSKLSLFGINYNDLNTMISDATGLFPRLCSNLSDIVFQKTKGNPFFVLEFLRTLADRNLLEYSVRKRRWVWDEEAIKSMEVTDNVLFLLTNKMSQLPENVQSTLKVVSCFGFGVHDSAIDLLSSTTQYSNIRKHLDELVWESFMVTVASKNSEGRMWKFVHDKVREAAYSLVADKDGDEYHEDLGQALYTASRGQKLRGAVLPIVDMINRGLKSAIRSPEMCIDIAELNLEAGVKCCEQSDFSTANAYLSNAQSLLPSDHWASHYRLSLHLYFLSAKTAYSCGNDDKACKVVRVILKEGRCIEDKVDAYFLLVNVYQAREESENAYLTCLDVLTELGEKDFLDNKLPGYCDGKDIAIMVTKITKSLEDKTEEEMLAIKGDGARHTSSIMKFYCFISIVAFFVKHEAVLPICCRMIELTLLSGVTKHSVMGLVQISATICQRSSLLCDVRGACDIGELGISLLDRIESSDIIAQAYFVYYGFAAHYTEPIQSCEKRLKRGFEAGMSNGDTFSAFFCANHHIRVSMIGGGNLSTLLRETEYYLNIAGQHGNIVAKKFFLMYQRTIMVLIDKDASNKNDGVSDELSQGESLCITRLSETMNFQKALQSFWLGYAERSHHYVLKLLQMSVLGRHHRLIITFFHAINSFMMLKRKGISKLRQIAKDALVALRAAAKDSKWNYGNKVYLLEAELSSHEGRNEDAKSFYAAAILASRSSRFKHEEGLACELAGFHYKKIGDLHRAWGFFNKAKQCYAEWGSDVKVNFITRQLSVLRDGGR